MGLLEWPGYAPFYRTQELGYYGNAPIELITFVDVEDIMRAYRQQKK